MSLFDPGSSTSLADVLGQQAQTATQGINEKYAKRKRQAVSQQAASGRLGSGVANYTLGDINAGQLGELGGVQSSLAGALAGVPTADYLSQQDNQQNSALAELLGKLNKKSDLEQLFGVLGVGGKIAGTAAAFA